jgi:HAD superfamily hydrolase (TIGR01509 family)
LLVDSEALQFEAWDTFVTRYGCVLDADIRARMYGTRLVDSAILVAQLLEYRLSPEEVARERDELFFSMIPGRMRPKPGAIELLADLAKMRVPTALATSGHRGYVDAACDSAGIPREFNVEVTGDLVARGKPDPETFLTAAERLGVEPAHCLVLEDSPQGVQAARAAAMICFAVPDEHGSGADLSAAHLNLDSLVDVLPAARAYGLAFSTSQG